MNILICSGFTETELLSFRENQYPRVLSENGMNVTVVTSTSSWIWRFNRAKRAPSNPRKNDEILCKKYNYTIKRSRPLIRIGDFLILIPPVLDIINADVVHIIEFRQGNGVIVAMLAKIFGKPVVYDHEQRGDRDYSFIHKIDSIFRRVLISLGSIFVDAVRHTVMENKKHYLKCALRHPKIIRLSPLAADEKVFNFSEKVRNQKRSELKIDDNKKCIIISGKLGENKKTIDVINASVRHNYSVILAGSIDVSLKKFLESSNFDITYVGNVDAVELNKLYNAADLAIFTTFSVSYWEALATGLNIAIPKTNFSEIYIDKDDAIFFGNESMFKVVEEQYKDDVCLEEIIYEKIGDLVAKDRKALKKYTWEFASREMIELYKEVISNKSNG